MANALNRNVTVDAFDGSPRTIVMTDNTPDLNDVQAIFQAMSAQEVKPGVIATGTITLRHDVSATPESPNGIASIAAYVTAGGAPAAIALLTPTTHYTVSGNVITIVAVSQAPNTLVITYHPKIDALVSDWRALFPRQ